MKRIFAKRPTLNREGTNFNSRRDRRKNLSLIFCNQFLNLTHFIQSQYPTASVGPQLFIANSDSKHFWDLADQIYRFNPIRLTNLQTKMFHGIDERISVENYVRTIVFMRHFIEMTDKRFCGKRDETEGKTSEKDGDEGREERKFL